MLHERVHERAAGVTRRGVDDHALRLVYHDEIVVLVDNVERNILRLYLERLRRGDFDLENVALLGLIALFQRFSVFRDKPVLNELRDEAAR